MLFQYKTLKSFQINTASIPTGVSTQAVTKHMFIDCYCNQNKYNLWRILYGAERICSNLQKFKKHLRTQAYKISLGSSSTEEEEEDDTAVQIRHSY